MDWPWLRFYTNDDMVQEQKLTDHAELRYRLRRGYLGIRSLSYPVRFRRGKWIEYKQIRVRKLEPGAYPALAPDTTIG